jgi:hypothetical protein
MRLETLIQLVLSALNQIKVYHWTTKSYSVHKALDDLHSKLQDSFDRLVECFIGSREDSDFGVFQGRTQFDSLSNVNNIIDYVRQLIDALGSVRSSSDVEDLPSIQNIVDDIVGHLQQSIYLLRLQK